MGTDGTVVDVSSQLVESVEDPTNNKASYGVSEQLSKGVQDGVADRVTKSRIDWEQYRQGIAENYRKWHRAPTCIVSGPRSVMDSFCMSPTGSFGL